MKIYVIDYQFSIYKKYKDRTKNSYSAEINSEGDELGDALISSIESLYPQKRDGNTSFITYRTIESNSDTLNINTEIDLDGLSNYNLTNYPKIQVIDVVKTSISKIEETYRKNDFPYVLKEDKEDPSVNNYSGDSNGGGYAVEFWMGSETDENPTQSTPIISPTQSVPIISPTQSISSIPDQLTPISQEVSKGEVSSDNTQKSKNTNAKFPGITNIFEPSIKLDPIKFEVPVGVKDKQEFIRGLGYVPFVWYNGYQINYTDIKYLSLYHDGILPKCKITFVDTFSIMKSAGFPLDDTKIQIFINAKSKNLKSIHLEFKIQNFQDLGGNTYTMIGTINIPSVYLKGYNSYSSKTSQEALQDLCKKMNIGFNSNLDNTDDKMTWINGGEKNYKFINDVIFNSYKSDSSFIVGYIDYYYNFNYVDIEREFSRDIKNDVGIDTGGLSAEVNSTEDDRITTLSLSNEPSFNNSSMYFDKYKVRNDSTSISLKKGYLTKVKFYDTGSKNFLIFDVDSITSDGTQNIILKSAPQDTKFFDENYSTIWNGKIDSDNSHNNFNYASVQNRLNIDEMIKISAELDLPNPNFNLYKFQKVNIIFINPNASLTSGLSQERLNGDWIITDINFIYSGLKMKQVIKIIKRELSASKDEMVGSDSSNKNKKDKKEFNENPSLGLTSSIG